MHAIELGKLPILSAVWRDEMLCSSLRHVPSAAGSQTLSCSFSVTPSSLPENLPHDLQPDPRPFARRWHCPSQPPSVLGFRLPCSPPSRARKDRQRQGNQEFGRIPSLLCSAGQGCGGECFPWVCFWPGGSPSVARKSFSQSQEVVW